MFSKAANEARTNLQQSLIDNEIHRYINYNFLDGAVKIYRPDLNFDKGYIFAMQKEVQFLSFVMELWELKKRTKIDYIFEQ